MRRTPPRFDPTSWRRQVDEWEAAGVPEPSCLRMEWTWNHTSWGHEGAHTYESRIVWFRHAHNPHASIGGNQSFQKFLNQGPMVSGASLEQLREIYAVARARYPDQLLG